MVDITTEQQVPFTFVVKDGRGRPSAIDGSPTVAISDDTVVSVAPLTSGDNVTWSGVAVSGAPGSARVTVTADSDITPDGVNDVVGILEVVVSLDPRTGSRIADMQAGAPEDKPV